jgi:hypothetical protein
MLPWLTARVATDAALVFVALTSTALVAYYRVRAERYATDLRVILWNSDQRQARMAFQSMTDCVHMVNTYARRALDEGLDTRARLNLAALEKLTSFVAREKTERGVELLERRDARR